MTRAGLRRDRAFELAGDGLIMSVGWAPADGSVLPGRGPHGLVRVAPAIRPSARIRPAGPIRRGPPQRRLPPPGPARRRPPSRAGGRGVPGTRPRRGLSGALRRPNLAPSHPYPIFPHPTAKSFVDLDEDVQYKDIVNAAQEGFDHVELLKRYATVGMGPTQGKLANINAIRVLSRIKGQTVPETGVTTSRPFYSSGPARTPGRPWVPPAPADGPARPPPGRRRRADARRRLAATGVLRQRRPVAGGVDRRGSPGRARRRSGSST